MAKAMSLTTISTTAKNHGGRLLTLGDVATVKWGGTHPNGTERTTIGRVIKITRGGRLTLARTNGRRNAHVHVSAVISYRPWKG